MGPHEAELEDWLEEDWLVDAGADELELELELDEADDPLEFDALDDDEDDELPL